MLKSAKLASAVLLLVIGGCVADQDEDVEIDPACEDDSKCDGVSSEGFEIFKGADSRYYFHMVSANGQIVMRSQGYSTKAAATKGVASVRTNGVDPENYKVLTASSGESYVNLYAQNNQVIATTETYARKFNAQRGIETAVKLVSKAQRIRAARSGARFQAIIGADHQSYFHIRGKNGEVMMASEGYLNPASAISGIESVRVNGKIASQYEVQEAADGQWFFRLKATNNEIVGHGETYATKANAQRAVDTLVSLLKSELVADATPAKPPARSMADRPELVKALDALSDIAAGGTTLAYFGYAEQAAKPAGITCKDVTVDQMVEEFDLIVDQVMTSGDAGRRPDLNQGLIASSRSQFIELLGTDSYQWCSRQVIGHQSSGAENYILSTSAVGPKIFFELGYDE